MSTTGGGRVPADMMTTAYGAPAEPYPVVPMPYAPTSDPFVPLAPADPLSAEKLAELLATKSKHRMRVAARKTDDGIAIKVYVDDKLVTETVVDGLAASIEFDVG